MPAAPSSMRGEVATKASPNVPSATNPVPFLYQALKDDNRELLSALLSETPVGSSLEGGAPFQQCLVFADASLRTLLLRHVLNNATGSKSSSNTNKGSNNQRRSCSISHGGKDDAQLNAGLDISSDLNIVATRLLNGSHNSNTKKYYQQANTEASFSPGSPTRSVAPPDSMGTPMRTSIDNVMSSGAAEVRLLSPSAVDSMTPPLSPSQQYNPFGSNDFEFDDDFIFGTSDTSALNHAPQRCMTYFLRPMVAHVRAVQHWIRRFENNAKRGTLRLVHRIVFLPGQSDYYEGAQTTSSGNNASASNEEGVSALCRKILRDAGLLALPNVSLQSLPLDMIPVETDVWTMGYSTSFRECELDGIPSALITAIAQSLLKMQDACAPAIIQRLQGLGPLAQAVLAKFLSLSVQDYRPPQEEDEDDPDESAINDPDDSISPVSRQKGDLGATSTVADTGEEEANSIDALLVIDRRVDLVTPMLTPLTYEGLLDDMLGIDCGVIMVDDKVINPEEDDVKSTKSGHSSSVKSKDVNHASSRTDFVTLPLHGSDTLYAEVRDQHVEKFGSFLQNQAKALKESHSAFTNKDKKKDLSEIHQFVKQIPIFTQNLRSLTTHIHLAELVKQTTEESTFRERWQLERAIIEGEQSYEILEDLIACQYPPYRLLRLLCLQSLTSGGIKSSKFDSLRREVVQTYGYEYLFVLNNMEKTGLFRRRETTWMDTQSSSFSNLRRLLVLINAEVDTVNPDDSSYVSSGYAPLTARLVQAASSGWMGKEEALRELPGRLVDVAQSDPPEELSTAMKRNPGGNLGALSKPGKQKPVLMVYFVGGVTFMEIAALRFLSKLESYPFHIVICTTNIINGNTFLQSLS
eukprot:CAMPEP_0198283006 /NCGR_PEP_ID=MMETSP1449-20131203/2702_1 /TAXON_ID=420275 /ORGANISM="Attheya septentrionalis, Strain CCMP2084" /LENGTH=861 /DNA_ID=CAMNT_0043979461 /DNA_START=78 /DNA_END=2663 /DNA_ORIENTATION=-